MKKFVISGLITAVVLGGVLLVVGISHHSQPASVNNAFENNNRFVDTTNQFVGDLSSKKDLSGEFALLISRMRDENAAVQSSENTPSYQFNSLEVQTYECNLQIIADATAVLSHPDKSTFAAFTADVVASNKLVHAENKLASQLW